MLNSFKWTSENDPLIELEEWGFGDIRQGYQIQRSAASIPRWLFVMTSFFCVVAIAFVAAFAITQVELQTLRKKDAAQSWLNLPPSVSPLEVYMKTADASDSDICSVIGNYMITVNGGSAVDGAIATMLCIGLSNMHSAGIGGGSFMLIHNKTTGSTHGIDFRETAPAGASENMFVNKPGASVHGGLAIGVPGEIAGYRKAWETFGRVPWSELFQPVIDMCTKGYIISETLGREIQDEEKKIRESPGLRALLVDPVTNKTYKAGDTLRNPLLAATFKEIAANPYSFYNGSLATKIVSEIQGAQGIITAQDLRNYRPEMRQPIKLYLPNAKLTVHGLPPPSSGVILAFMLGVLDGYKMTSDVKKDLQSFGLYHHRLIETFKFAYAKRSALGDLAFLNSTIHQLVKNLTSQDYIDFVRGEIDDSRTYPVSHYGPSFEWKEDHGTSHLSVVAPNGDAVAITSTINTVFASGVRGLETGIIYNNEMDDFSTPNTTNSFDIPASPSNFIAPGKRPMSSMAPTIITDDLGNAVLVVGASGGSLITTATAYIASRVLFLGDNVKEAIDYPRPHHQLVPNVVMLGKGFPEQISEILKKKGHKIGPTRLSVVQAIHRKDGKLYANSDYRKGGKPSGQ